MILPRWPGKSRSVQGPRGLGWNGTDRKLVQGGLHHRGAPAITWTYQLGWSSPQEIVPISCQRDSGSFEKAAATSMTGHKTQQPNRFCKRTQRTSHLQKRESALDRWHHIIEKLGGNASTPSEAQTDTRCCNRTGHPESNEVKRTAQQWARRQAACASQSWWSDYCDIACLGD